MNSCRRNQTCLHGRWLIARSRSSHGFLPGASVGRSPSRWPMHRTLRSHKGLCPRGCHSHLVQLHYEGLIELVAGDDASDRVTLAPGGIADSAGHEIVAIARIRRKAAK